MRACKFVPLPDIRTVIWVCRWFEDIVEVHRVDNECVYFISLLYPIFDEIRSIFCSCKVFDQKFSSGLVAPAAFWTSSTRNLPIPSPQFSLDRSLTSLPSLPFVSLR